LINPVAAMKRWFGDFIAADWSIRILLRIIYICWSFNIDISAVLLIRK
jgi:hypothetical protein